MMIKLTKIVEMALPTRELKAKTYYHGTQSETAALKIMKDGIRYRCDDKGICDPIKGRVYITQNLTIALGYATDNPGIEEFKSIKDNTVSIARSRRSRGGNRDLNYYYVIVIDGSELSDVYPDEDELGFLAASGKNQIVNNVFDKHIAEKTISEDIREQLEDEIGLKVGELKSEKNKVLLDLIESTSTVSFWVASYIGKLISKHLTQKDCINILKITNNISHKGTLKAKEVYKLSEDGLSKMKSINDFFKYAKKIK